MAFYVTVSDKPFAGGRPPGRVGFLAGPFRRHGDALRLVTATKRAAREVDPDAVWYAFGTSQDKASHERVGKLNDQLGLVLDSRGFAVPTPLSYDDEPF